MPQPISDTPRRIPGFLIPLIHQTTRGGNARVRGQVDIPGQARHIQAVQFDRVDQVLQGARGGQASLLIRLVSVDVTETTRD